MVRLHQERRILGALGQGEELLPELFITQGAAIFIARSDHETEDVLGRRLRAAQRACPEEATYAARARHSSNAVKRLCL